MGRPTKPSAVKQAQGTIRADRRNDAEPEFDLLDDLAPPSHLPERSAAVWREVAPMLRKGKVLTAADGIALEMLCDAVADYRRCRERLGDGDESFVTYSAKGSQVLNQWLVAKQMSSKRAEAFMSKFGMDPASRSRVMVDPQMGLFGDAPVQPSAPAADRFFKH